MYSLQLSSEQLEIRDTVRDFVTREIKPVALKAERLDVNDRSLLLAQIDAASQMGLRTLALSEERGGAGADALTSCIVTEELAAGDADIAAVLSESSRLAHVLFDRCMNDAQRGAFLPKFMSDDRYHLAFAGREGGTDTRLGVNYHRPATMDVAVKTTAAKSGNDFIINGVKDCVANAPIAGLFAVLVQIPGRSHANVLLVPADAPGLSVRAARQSLASRRLRRGHVQGLQSAGGQSARRRRGGALDRRGRARPRQSAGAGAQSRHRPRRLRGRARLRASARAGRPPAHRAPGDRHQARRDRDPAGGRARRRSGRRPGPAIIPKRSPTAACPICRCKRSRRCSRPRRS